MMECEIKESENEIIHEFIKNNTEIQSDTTNQEISRSTTE